jgi:hypothetical protein
MATHWPSSLEEKWREQKLARMDQQIADGTLVVAHLSKEKAATYKVGTLTATRS